MSFLCLLPLDVLILITNYLNTSDLSNLMLTCKTLSNILKANAIWRSRDNLVINTSTDNSTLPKFSWYNRCRISHNWCSGVFKSKVVIQYRTNFMPWIKFYNSKVLVLSVGSDLQCYPTDKSGTPNCKSPLWQLEIPAVKRNDVRTNDISRFVIRDNIIVCGNRDGCAAVYKFQNIKHKPYQLYHLRDCHEAGSLEVSAVDIISNKNVLQVVTASSKSPNLGYWSLTPDEIIGNELHCTKKNIQHIPLQGYSGVRCLALDTTHQKLAIGLNGNSKPILLDITTHNLLLNAHETENITQAVRDIQWHNENLIAFVTHSGLLQMIDVRTSQVVYDAMDPFQSTLYCLKTDGCRAVLVGSSVYSRSVLFDTRYASQHVQLYFTQNKTSPIYSLDFDSTKLVAAADRSVATLNFNVNGSTTQRRDYSHAFEFVKR